MSYEESQFLLIINDIKSWIRQFLFFIIHGLYFFLHSRYAMFPIWKSKVNIFFLDAKIMTSLYFNITNFYISYIKYILSRVFSRFFLLTTLGIVETSTLFQRLYSSKLSFWISEFLISSTYLTTLLGNMSLSSWIF